MVYRCAGTTIEAVAVLERENLRSAVIDANTVRIRKIKGGLEVQHRRFDRMTLM